MKTSCQSPLLLRSQTRMTWNAAGRLWLLLDMMRRLPCVFCLLSGHTGIRRCFLYFCCWFSCSGQSTYRCFSIFAASTRFSVTPKIPSANFWMAILRPASNVHRLVTGTAFFMPSMKWRRSSLLMPSTSGRPKNFCRTLFRMCNSRRPSRNSSLLQG